MVTDLATGEAVEHDPDEGKNKAALELGRKGGAARAKSMSPERRAEIAKKAAAKRDQPVRNFKLTHYPWAAAQFQVRPRSP